MITVLADKYLYQLSFFLPPAVRLRLYDPHTDWPPRLDDIDALLIRTVNKIDESTLKFLPDSLKFIGTGSAGTDHVDTDLLDRQGIMFASAAGCNAWSVAEYVATVLLIWAEKKDQKLSQKTVGIIGAGNVGSALQKLLKAMGVPFIVHDPPRAEKEYTFTSATFRRYSLPIF
jgi:erythronate-4-phosphate dehydrogenase